MSLSGPDALKSLDEALLDIRREEDDIAKRLARSAELIGKISAQKGELFRQLAGVRLDPATQVELGERLGQAEIKARQMLKQHGESLAAAEKDLRQLDQRIATLAAERASLQKAAAERDAELEALRARVLPDLRADKNYAAKTAEATQLAAIADEAMQKTLLAEADREQKGRPYRDDPLFMYLWNGGYGTKGYRVNNLVAWLDGIVARLVNYADARPNYAMLTQIPVRLREHAERQIANAGDAATAVAALERAAIDAAGGKAARAALEDASKRIEAIDQEMVTAEDQRDTTAKTQRALAQGSDPAFTDAVATLAEALEREDLKILLADARATRTAEDDTVIQQIDDARQRVADEEADTREQKTRLRTLAARRRELEDIQYEFKKQGFDNPRSRFGEDRLVGDMLNDFLRGGITAAAYWQSWRQSQNWAGGAAPRNDWNFDPRFGTGAPPGKATQWPDNSFAGGGNRQGNGGIGGPGGGWGRLPGGFGGASGGGFSRPRTGSAGTRSGGGFKTGGGF